MIRITRATGAVALLAAASLIACGDDDPTGPAGPIDVTLNFAAAVNGADFACGTSYADVGTSATEITPVDFRFYVHGVELIEADGSSQEVELDENSWQRDGVVLLDFENGSGPCVNGTAATNTAITGSVPAGDYTGIRFVLGVSEDLNHADQTTAAAPLDLTGLFWSWNAGYKFLRIDHTSEAQPEGWFVHLGSTGCQPAGDPTIPATSCANPHRPTIELTGFDWSADEIVADYGALLADSDLTANTAAKGCMSFPNDPECHQVMPNLGLAYEGTASSGQTFFSVR